MKKTLIAAVIATAALAAHAESVTYMVDPGHTNAMFAVTHFGTSTYRGRFNKKEGTVTLDTAAKTGKVEVDIDVASVDTGAAALDTDLKSEAFFDAAKYPTIKFVGDKFSFSGDKVTSVAGMLTMHGQTHPVTLTATHFNCYDNPMLKRQVCGGDFEGNLLRSQWGITKYVPMPVTDEVKLVIQIEAVKQ